MSQHTRTPSGTNTGLIVLIGFAILLALTGGTSQSTAPHLVALRPLSALFLAAALYWWQSGESHHGRPVLYFVLAWTIWTFVQLVPLPSWAWQNLPDRELVAELDQLLGVQGQWRPISWVPTRGWNALAAMIVPLTALLLAMALRARGLVLLNILLCVAILDASMNMLQLISGGQSNLYFYKHHPGAADGIFSNENHSGVFSAIGLLIATRLSLASARPGRSWQKIVYGASVLFFLLAVLIGGSRAALVAGLGALVSAAAMLYSTLNAADMRHSSDRPMPFGSRRISLAIMSVLFFGGLVGSFFWLERSASFDGILSRNTFEDLRWRIAPILWEMIQKNWPLGIGFGAFEEYYHIYEPTELMMPLYINQAHNDWGQSILEGGFVAVAIAVGLASWTFRQLAALWSRERGELQLLIFWVSAFVVVAAASIVDYPLRTPIFQVAAVWLLLVLGQDGGGVSHKERSAVA